ncbi:MAG: polyprenyl synthetase family protein [Cyclobacteriaceae bacterium]|nr:polyprenyl synthetase family protein [Cyclobacteriaceae bacterium]
MNDTIKKYIQQIDQEIYNLSFGRHPENLYDPIRYILQLGGKRIRPLLSVLAYSLFQNDYMKIVRPSLAVEVFHNFTLLHDDIMDKAPIRRGKPTVHHQWNENTAILSGDVMLVRVYDLLLEVQPDKIHRVIKDFNNCAAQVCEGQQMDMDFETQPRVSEDEYIRMIRYKTAVLLGYSLSLGGILADANESDILLLTDFGINLGIGFQLMDDLLDVFADNHKFGKQVGGDIITNKKTLLLITAIELTRGREQEDLYRWIEMKNFDPAEKVQAVKAIYEKTGIRELAIDKMNHYFSNAQQDLDKIAVSEGKKVDLRDLTDYLMKREN